MVETLYPDEVETQVSSPGTIYDSKERRFFPALVRRRDNPFYRRGMAIRYAMQLHEEEVDHYEGIAHHEWNGYRQRLARTHTRYKLFPQEEETIIASEMGQTPLPDTTKMRIILLDEWIARIPEGKRVGGTRDFGGHWKGSRSPSREPGRYTRLNLPLTTIVRCLESDEISYQTDLKGNVLLMDLDVTRAQEYVESLEKCYNKG